MNLIICGLPRSGTSLLTKIISSANYETTPFIKENKSFYSLNKGGYQEDILVTLINDQLIRAVYGDSFSFLFPPNVDSIKKITIDNKFKFDINKKTLFIPIDYEENIKKYTGHSWDVWGLTRMQNGGKWYKCYSKNKIDNSFNLKEKIEKCCLFLNNHKKDFLLKDPRFLFTLPFWNIKNCKVLIIKRSYSKNLSSMRRHYGVNLFKKVYIKDTNYVSNHFNYKIKYMSENSYISKCENAINYLINNYNCCIVKFEELINRKKISTIEKFIDREVNLTFIDKNQVNFK